MGKEAVLRGGVSRRDFMKTCVAATAIMGLPYSMHAKVAEAAQKAGRPAVIWLHFQECTGCSESLLRSSHPDVSELILDMISLDYHETLMVGSGHQAEQSLHDSMKANHGTYILVVEGGIPTKDNGIYCKVGGKTAVDSLTPPPKGPPPSSPSAPAPPTAASSRLRPTPRAPWGSAT